MRECCTRWGQNTEHLLSAGAGLRAPGPPATRGGGRRSPTPGRPTAAFGPGAPARDGAMRLGCGSKTRTAPKPTIVHRAGIDDRVRDPVVVLSAETATDLNAGPVRPSRLLDALRLVPLSRPDTRWSLGDRRSTVRVLRRPAPGAARRGSVPMDRQLAGRVFCDLAPTASEDESSTVMRAGRGAVSGRPGRRPSGYRCGFERSGGNWGPRHRRCSRRPSWARRGRGVRPDHRARARPDAGSACVGAPTVT